MVSRRDQHRLRGTRTPRCQRGDLRYERGRFGPDELGVNFDTGNCFLAGNDPVEYVRAVASRVVHVHVKDIPATQLAERGKVTGTRVGVAAGEGVVDLPGILEVLAAAGYQGVLSVECGTWAQARASRQYLERLLGDLAP